MPKVKTKIGYGTHHSPQGPVEITRERATRWGAAHAKMRSGGIDVPAPWAHNKEALPSAKDSAFFKSKYNAGYVDSITAGDDGVEFVLDVPGAARVESGKLLSTATLPDGTPVTTAIKEVSPSIAAVFRDGQNNVWSDVITHVALTPLPVAAGQPGFTEMAAGVEGFVSLSLDATWLAMDETPPAKEGAVPREEPDDKKVDEKKPDDKPPDQPATNLPDGLLDQLAALGMRLPDDTSIADLPERLLVAATALNHKPGGQPGGAANAPVQEEQPESMLMSLEPQLRPAFEKIIAERNALVAERKQKRFAEVKGRFDGAALPADLKARFFAPLATQNLALEAVDEAALDLLSDRLDLALAAQATGTAELATRLTAATDHPNPLEPSAQKLSKHADDVVRRAAGLPATQGAV